MTNPFFPIGVDPTAAHAAILGLVLRQDQVDKILDAALGQHRKLAAQMRPLFTLDRRICEIAKAMCGIDHEASRIARNFLGLPSIRREDHNG